MRTVFQKRQEWAYAVSFKPDYSTFVTYFAYSAERADLISLLYQ